MHSIGLANPPPATLGSGVLKAAETNHYATLGLDRKCTETQIRSAYRLLAKQHHPDLNQESVESVRRTQALNAAYETLSDPDRRQAYDKSFATPRAATSGPRSAKAKQHLAEDLHLSIEDLLQGTRREVRIKDPSNPDGLEIYELHVPAGTAPGARFRLPRTEPFVGSFVQIRVKALPGYRFKVRGSDLRCDLKIKPERAAQGGGEMIPGATGAMVQVTIPRGVERNEVVRIPGEGLPRPRGGRGDLLVRITYRPEIRITRPTEW